MEKKNRKSAGKYNFWTCMAILACEVPTLAFLGAAIFGFYTGHPVVGSFCLFFSIITFPQIKM